MKKRKHSLAVSTIRMRGMLRAAMPEYNLVKGPISYMLFVRLRSGIGVDSERDMEFLLKDELGGK